MRFLKNDLPVFLLLIAVFGALEWYPYQFHAAHGFSYWVRIPTAVLLFLYSIVITIGILTIGGMAMDHHTSFKKEFVDDWQSYLSGFFIPTCLVAFSIFVIHLFDHQGLAVDALIIIFLFGNLIVAAFAYGFCSLFGKSNLDKRREQEYKNSEAEMHEEHRQAAISRKEKEDRKEREKKSALKARSFHRNKSKYKKVKK